MKLLDEYKGKKVIAKGVKGYVTFDTNNTDEIEYPMYHSLGFDFCFEPIEPKYKAPRKYIGIEQSDSNNSQQKKNVKKDKVKTEKT